MKVVASFHCIIVLAVLTFCNAFADEHSDPIDATVEIFADTGRYEQVGSGFFISSNGDIATAYHVIAGAKSLQILGHQGSYDEFVIKAYDPAKDLAIISVKTQGPITFIPIKAPPSTLANKTGLVLGNPDLKKDFAVHVTFPRDRPLLSSEWSATTQAGGQRWIFAQGNVKLIAVDGTLNHGMSGGAVILDGAAIGVFSGGEQQSGGGFGWPISAEYLSTLTRAPTGTLLSSLPPLTLLSPNSEKPSMLKAVKTQTGKTFFPQLMNFNAARSNVQKYMLKTPEIYVALKQCEPYLISLSDGDSSQPPVDGTAEQLCLALVFIAERVLTLADFAVAGMSDQITSFHELDIGSKVADRLKIAGTVDVKQGIFKAAADVGPACEFDQRLAERVQNEALKLKTAEATAANLPGLPQEANRSSDSRMLISYLQHSYGKLFITSRVAIYGELPRFLDSIYFATGPLVHCLESAMSVIDFQADMSRSDEAVKVDQLSPAEQGFFLGVFVGYYYSNVALADECQRRYRDVSDLDEAEFAFKQKHLLYLRRAQDIAARNDGTSDYEEMKQRTMQQAQAIASRLVGNMDYKGLGLKSCKMLPKYLREHDISVDNPDTAEAVSGSAVNRSKNKDQSVRATVQRTLANAFAPALRRNPMQASDVIPSLLPNLLRSVILSWEENFIEQCSQLASPLPQEVSADLTSTLPTVRLEKAKVRDSISGKIVSAGGSAPEIGQFWDELDIAANEMNMTFMNEFGVQTSSSLAGACVSFSNPDVQTQISKSLHLSDSEMLQLLSQ
jgi:hypothetical protein